MTIKLDCCEFYITNICNLTCENCNRFNNFDTKGRVEFDVSMYEWTKDFEFGYIGIIGGEPLLHPNLGEWVDGIRSLFPTEGIVITSNGTQINKHPGLFDIVTRNNARLEISLHDKAIDAYIWEQIETFKEKGTNWIEDKTEFTVPDRDGNDIGLESHNLRCDERFTFTFTDAHYFQQNQFQSWIDGKPKPCNSDPNDAHYACGIKNSHTFYNGKLYKCGFIPSVIEYLDQHQAKEGWEKVYNYEPHSSTDNISRLTEPEDVCSLCPSKYCFSKVKTSFK